MRRPKRAKLNFLTRRAHAPERLAPPPRDDPAALRRYTDRDVALKRRHKSGAVRILKNACAQLAALLAPRTASAQMRHERRVDLARRAPVPHRHEKRDGVRQCLRVT